MRKKPNTAPNSQSLSGEATRRKTKLTTPKKKRNSMLRQKALFSFSIRL